MQAELHLPVEKYWRGRHSNCYLHAPRQSLCWIRQQQLPRWVQPWDPEMLEHSPVSGRGTNFHKQVRLFIITESCQTTLLSLEHSRMQWLGSLTDRNLSTALRPMMSQWWVCPSPTTRMSSSVAGRMGLWSFGICGSTRWCAASRYPNFHVGS